MAEEERIDAVVHKRDDIPVEKFGEGIDRRYVAMSTIAQTSTRSASCCTD